MHLIPGEHLLILSNPPFLHGFHRDPPDVTHVHVCEIQGVEQSRQEGLRGVSTGLVVVSIVELSPAECIVVRQSSNQHLDADDEILQGRHNLLLGVMLGCVEDIEGGKDRQQHTLPGKHKQSEARGERNARESEASEKKNSTHRESASRREGIAPFPLHFPLA